MDTSENTLLAKWLDKSITPLELQKLEQEVDLVALGEVLKTQEAFDLEVVDSDVLWQRFLGNVNGSGDGSESGSGSDSGSENRGDEKGRLKRRYFIGLAVLVFGLIGFWIWKQNSGSGKKIETQPGQTQSIPIADGSAIKLSPGSLVRYDEAGWGQERRVYLEGQAYFQVEKGATFTVETPVGSVEVLGTAFDIWVFGDYMSVQCFEGKVEVTNIQNGEKAGLTPGKQVVLNNKVLENVENFEGTQPNWIEKNQHVYKRIPVSFVINDIRRFLTIEVQTEDLDLDAEFSGLIPFKTAEETARYLAESMGWNYSTNDAKILFKQ